MKIRLLKLNTGYLAPETAEDAQQLMKVEPGETIEATIRRPRNPRFHRYVWALVSTVAANWPGKSITGEQAMVWLKLKTGHVEIVKNPETGDDIVLPASIAYDAMGQDEFAAWWYEQALPACSAVLEVEQETLERELPERPMLPAPTRTYKVRT